MPGNCFLRCGCNPEGPPFCWPTLRLLDCDTDPIQGATVTVTTFPTVAGITPVVGTTDVDGKYAFPSTLGARNAFFIAWDGASSGPYFGIDFTRYNCTHTIDFCYRYSKVTINTTADAYAALFPNTGVTGNGTPTVVSEYKAIQYCSARSVFPYTTTAGVLPVDPTKYVDNCAPVTVNCGDEITLNIPMFKWDDDYAVHNNCDQGCATYGEGPNHRGLAPKVLHVTPSTVVGQTLGIYEGVPITVTWDGTKWDSGCLPPPGVQCSPPYSPAYQSARLIITIGPGGLFGGAGGDFLIRFGLFVRDDCATTPRGTTPPCNDKFIVAGTPCGLTAPVNVDLPATVESPSDASQYNFHVTE